MSRIYLASSWRNEHQPIVLEALRANGHEVYDFRNPEAGNNGFSWREVDPDWKDWTPARWRDGLDHPIARRGFDLDFGAMKWADTCVLLLPAGPSAAIEAGWSKGSGRRLIVCALGLREPDLMYAMADDIVLTIRELLDALEHVPVGGPNSAWPGRF